VFLLQGYNGANVGKRTAAAHLSGKLLACNNNRAHAGAATSDGLRIAALSVSKPEQCQADQRPFGSGCASFHHAPDHTCTLCFALHVECAN